MTGQNLESLVEQFPIEVKQILALIIKKEGFISHDVSKTAITEKVHYLGILHGVDIKGKIKGGDKETNLIIKLPRQINMDFFTIEDVFNREFYAYSELFKIYEEFQDNANVPDEDRFQTVKCFDGSTSEVIILENLSRKGFKTLPGMEVVPLTFAEVSMEQLAKFHALSVVLQNRRPEYFERKVKTLENMCNVDTAERCAVIDKLFSDASEHLSEGSKKCIPLLLDTVTEEVNKHVRNPKTFKCLCHGDIRIGNILCRKQDCRIEEVVFIDYQMINYCSPINDFMYFIFLGTDREFRRKHFDHLKNVYYNHLQRFLKYFNIDLNHVWPREEFENQFKECLNFGFIRTMSIFPFIFADENNVPDLTNSILSMDMHMNRWVHDRIQGLVDDFIEWRRSPIDCAPAPDNTNDILVAARVTTTRRAIS